MFGYILSMPDLSILSMGVSKTRLDLKICYSIADINAELKRKQDDLKLCLMKKSKGNSKSTMVLSNKL